MTTNEWFEVKEKQRIIVFTNGMREKFHNVTKVNARGGNWLRFMADEGYVIVNTENVLYIAVDGEMVR